MKRIFFNMMILAASIPLFMSCDGMMDTHQEFIEGGEIIYSPKVDSLNFIAGEGRVLFEFWLQKSPNVKSVDVYWNSKSDSMLIPVTASSERDSFYIQIPNLAEQAYTFEVRTTDNFGHKSLWVSGFGNSYGERYASTIANRRVRDISLNDKGGIVNWMAAGDGAVRVEIRYTKKDGSKSLVYTSAKDGRSVLPDVLANSAFEYRTLYIPEELSIDTFSLSWTTYEKAFPTEFQFDKSEWRVVSVSDETASDGGGKDVLIDGDTNNWWHSQWDGGDAPLPHWAIIDMASPKDFFKVDVYRRPGNTDTKTVLLFVSDSDDPDGDWTLVGDGQFVSGNLLTIEIAPGTNTTLGRYLKLLLPDSNRAPFTSIAEITLWGK